jgi:hypothetical protein
MPHDDDPRIDLSTGGPAPTAPGPLARVFGVIVGAAVLAVSLVFSVVVFAVLLAVGVVVGGYLWWRTRELRRQLRQMQQEMAARMQAQAGFPGDARDGMRGGPVSGPYPPARDDTVLDGDYIREVDRPEAPERARPQAAPGNPGGTPPRG